MRKPWVEVRVRSFLFGVTIACAALHCSSGFAQAASQPAASPASQRVPSAPVPQSGMPLSTIPAPVPEPKGTVPSLPGYQQKPDTPPPSIPAPVMTPPPAVSPAQPTPAAPYRAVMAYGADNVTPKIHKERYGSTYIPVDSWVYPALLRLYSMGYVDTMYLAMRPYTRRSVLHMLKESENDILADDNAEAQDILATLYTELSAEGTQEGTQANYERGTVYGVESVYTRMMGIGGQVLRDSFHLGQTIANDYGRPYQTGFSNVTGFSTVNESGPFSLYVRGEYQHAPAAAGYSQTLAAELSTVDQIFVYAPPNDPQSTIPAGPIVAQNPFRLMEATLSAHALGHEISFGKSDSWQGPGLGGGMSWSNNAENIYSFRINRVEPLHIKYLSALLGPIRYDFFYGSLKGHTYPNHPWVHSDMFEFQPTKNLQLGLQRTIVFGGAGHEPVTLHTFLKGFFDTNDTNETEKFSRDDPGARFSSFNFSYRLPFVRNYLTLYTDSETHDDLTPLSAPRRAAYRPGIYLSHFPHMPRLDLRVEGVSTDCSTLVCQGGQNEYRETIQKQAYTNKGFIFGDWIGPEAKGGQAWLTYHLSGNEWISLQYLNKKTPKDFIAGGTTQNQFKVDVVKRIGPDLEVHGWFQMERWKAPIYLAGQQNDTTTAVQLTFFPRLKTRP